MSVVALDIGTSRMKAILADWDGRITGLASARTPALVDGSGRFAFPADEVRKQAASLVGGIARAHADDPVDTLVFSCLGTAMVPVDSTGRPLGPALSPTDTRPAQVPGLMDGLHIAAGDLFDQTGQDPRLPSFLQHWLWWRHRHPQLMRRLHRFRSLRGYVLEGLCAADAEDPSWASRTMLMDLTTSSWATAILDAADLPLDALPRIVPSATAWPVNDQGSTFGLAPGARVVLGAMDNCCAFLGASDPAEERLVNIAGTYEHMAGIGGLAIARLAAAAVNGLVHRYPIADQYLGYSRVPLGPLLAEVETASPSGLERLMEGISDRPVGGVVGLDPAAVGDALRGGTAPGTVLQGILEASAHTLVRFTDAWTQAGGKVDRVVAVGGGAAHPRVLQLKANLLGRPLSTLESDEAAGLGALRLAAIAARGASLGAACDLFRNPIVRTWSPSEGFDRPDRPDRGPKPRRPATPTYTRGMDSSHVHDLERASARRLLARVAYLLYDRRLTELQGGNMSLRIGDEVVITPTKASENDGWRLGPDDMVVHGLSGAVLAGDPARVSRETALHLRLYRAFADVGSVFHLHVPEALGAAAAGRWSPGVVADSEARFGAPVCLLETGLPAQTEAHDSRVEALLGSVPRAAGAISISPGHGIVSVARDVPANVRTVDILRQRLEEERIRARLRGARMGAVR